MDKSTWKWRRPIIKFVISPSRYRQNTIKEPPRPIKRSRYAQELWNEGAGWKDE